MRGPHVRFCERREGVILRAYSTRQRIADYAAPEGFGNGGAAPIAAHPCWALCVVALETVCLDPGRTGLSSWRCRFARRYRIPSESLLAPRRPDRDPASRRTDRLTRPAAQSPTRRDELC